MQWAYPGSGVDVRIAQTGPNQKHSVVTTRSHLACVLFEEPEF